MDTGDRRSGIHRAATGVGAGDRVSTAILPDTRVPSHSDAPIQVGDRDSFELRIGDIAVLGDEMPLVQFTEVIDDSRCSEGEQCIWEGEVRVAAVWSFLGETTSFDLWGLHVDGRPMFGEAPTMTFSDYELSLTDLRYQDGLPMASFAWHQET